MKKTTPAVTAAVTVCAAVVLLPVLLTVTTSLGVTPQGAALTPDGYLNFFILQPKYLRAFFLSLIIAAAVTVGSLTVALPAAFVLAKKQSRLTEWLFLLYVVIMVIPFQAMMLPQYLLFDRMGALDSAASLILPGIFSAFPVFLLTQNLKLLPNDSIEAAMLETSSPAVILLHIILPAIRPAMTATAVLTFSETWCQVAEPIAFIDSTEKLTLPAITLLSDAPAHLTAVAAAVMVTLPLLLYLATADEIGEMTIKA